MSSSSSGYSGSPGPAGLGHMSTLGRQQQHHQQQQQSHILPGSLNVVAVAGLGNPHPSGTNAFLPSTMVLPSEVSNNSASGLTGGCGASRNIISSPIQVGSGPSKGLLNGPGQNNCFLNCAVQVSPATCIN